MQILLYALGGLLVLVAVASVLLYFRAKRYLAESQEGLKGTASGIIEEIDSYHEKTQ
ncbi:MAG: hypothetical protein V3R29_07740 [Candidatus Acidoferrales bacterium]